MAELIVVLPSRLHQLPAAQNSAFPSLKHRQPVEPIVVFPSRDRLAVVLQQVQTSLNRCRQLAQVARPNRELEQKMACPSLNQEQLVAPAVRQVQHPMRYQTTAVSPSRHHLQPVLLV